MNEFLHALFNGFGFMPHGHCYLWKPGLVWLHVVSDALIVLAYYSIPVTLLFFVRKKKDLVFGWIFVCFAIFILACGTTHLMEIWNVWHSMYWVSGGIKAITAVASVPTALLLVRLVPLALAMASPEQMRLANEALQEEIRTRRRVEEEVNLLNRDLEQRVLERTAELHATNDELRRQISERIHAEEALRVNEAEFRASFHSIAVGQAQVEPTSGRYLRVNQKFCEIAGYSEEELLGMTFRDLTLPEDREEDSAAHGRMVRGEAPANDRVKRYLRKDGTSVWVHVIASMIHGADGQPPRTLAVVQDITERKAAEEVVRKLNAELEDRVAARTAELQSANEQLEAFSYSVSHDLRAPLRAIDGFSQALLEDYSPQLAEGGQRYLRTIRRGAQQMGMLIDDLLEFSRLSRAPLKVRPVNVQQLVRETLDELQSQIDGRQVDIRLGELPACQGDPALLKQVWVNLLSNAFKYSRPCDHAVVEIGCEPGPDGGAYFVRDNGAGFDMRYAGKLFGVFQRLHRAEDFEGTGVGLAIVQRIVQRHSGRVWVEAAVNRGATFHFTLHEEKQS